MVPENATASDVHAHMHIADLAGKPENPWGFERKSARAGAPRDARVIPLHPDQEQEEPPRKIRRDRTGLGGELQAGIAAANAAADSSDWARPAMTPVLACKQVAPRKGEAGNWITWSAMTVAGLLRAAWVSIGYLIVLGTDSRTKAAVTTSMLVAAVALSMLAQHPG